MIFFWGMSSWKYWSGYGMALWGVCSPSTIAFSLFPENCLRTTWLPNRLRKRIRRLDLSFGARCVSFRVRTSRFGFLHCAPYVSWPSEPVGSYYIVVARASPRHEPPAKFCDQIESLWSHKRLPTFLWHSSHTVIPSIVWKLSFQHHGRHLLRVSSYLAAASLRP